NAMVRFRTVMCAFGSTSDAQDVEGHGEDAAGADHEHDARDHRGGRRLADGGAAAALQAPEAPRHGDEDAVDRRLEHAAGDVAEVDGVDGLVEVDARRDAEHAPADGEAAEDAEQV